jgi:hypothetical protein
MPTDPSPRPDPAAAEPEWLSIVRSKVRGLRYGIVQLVVHDGRVTQIERTERTRLPSASETPERAG